MNIVAKVRQALIAGSDPKTLASSKRFFKEAATFHGTSSKVVSQINKEAFLEVQSLTKAEIFAICEELFQSGISEEAWIAADWAYKIHEQYALEDFQTFDRWVKMYIDNWAKCDTLCNHAVGELVMKFPELIEKLKDWAKSKNRWVKRAAAVSLIIPARRGLFLKDVLEIANILLLDKDDMVQKGYGWMLKAASESHQKEVFDYVVKNKAVMPRTALRYAIEKMPETMRKEAMQK